MSIFSKMERAYHWQMTGVPVPLEGGYTHRMYRIETRQGTYALKVLNRSIMRRETAMDNFAQAERLEGMLEQRGLPILPALTIDGRKMREIDGEYFYLFDYYDGKPLRAEEKSSPRSTIRTGKTGRKKSSLCQLTGISSFRHWRGRIDGSLNG